MRLGHGRSDGMARQHITSGSSFERNIGYARAVVDGDWVFVSGTTGFDYASGTIAEDVVAQCERCIDNIAGALDEAGFSLADVVRVRYILPDAADFEPCWPVLRARFGPASPPPRAPPPGGRGGPPPTRA